jgi:plasmid stabilization system protein ParE
MKVEFLAPAHEELLEAIEYYNEQSEGLGFEFAAETQRTIERIVQYPEAWTPLSKRTRRCRMSRFPYGVVYQIKAQTILIVAVMHLRRPPNSWKGRRRD